jgi:hypothetical protein
MPRDDEKFLNRDSGQEKDSPNNKVLDYFRRLVESLPINNGSENKTEQAPTNLRIVTIDQLKSNPELFDALIDCYQDVFGSSDIWGEGFVCEKCGKVMPLDQEQAKCDCGGELKKFYPGDELKNKIIRGLNNEDQRTPFCTIIENPSQEIGTKKRIDGFCWGSVDTLGNVVREIVENRYHGNQDKLKEIFDLFRGETSPIDLEEKILYIAELGVRQEARHHGMTSVINLARAGFERGHEGNTKKSLMWTSKKSPVYKICLACGFQEIFNIKEGDEELVFLYLEDLEPILTLMKNKTIRESELILAKASRILQDNNK